MSLVEPDLFEGKIDKVKIAIENLKYYEREEGYYLAFSGGKDSIVIKELANMAKVKYDAHYSVTTIDPPELIYFMRKHYPDVVWDRPDEPFLTRMIKKGFPQRQRRWCCAEYKERGGSGRLVITGIRKAESNKRAGRQMVESCYKDDTKQYLNIIINWKDEDVWEFIRNRKLSYCRLYDEGFKRIGCVFCPMASKQRLIEVERYPGFVKAFIWAFEELYKRKKEAGKTSVDRWKNGKEMFEWWINENRTKEEPDQYVLFE